MSKNNNIYTIHDACIACGKCAKNCPVKAIEFKESAFRYNINTDICIKCGKCYNGCVYGCVNKECPEDIRLFNYKFNRSKK
jgi:ferredoxin